MMKRTLRIALTPFMLIARLMLGLAAFISSIASAVIGLAVGLFAVLSVVEFAIGYWQNRVLIYQKDTTLQSLQMAAWQALLFEPHCSDGAEELNKERTAIANCFARMVYWSQKDDFEQFGLISTRFVKAIASSKFITSDKVKERMVEALNCFFQMGSFTPCSLKMQHGYYSFTLPTFFYIYILIRPRIFSCS